uniref:Uncharacterized protein n=1 Tax=Cacopsylla melanoneura TaxID=428564 RepID=A0A8D8X055_9HEMI
MLGLRGQLEWQRKYLEPIVRCIQIWRASQRATVDAKVIKQMSMQGTRTSVSKKPVSVSPHLVLSGNTHCPLLPSLSPRTQFCTTFLPFLFKKIPPIHRLCVPQHHRPRHCYHHLVIKHHPLPRHLL